MSSYFSLDRSFRFYGSYHSDPINQWIHIICVPIIFTTSMELLSRVFPQLLVLGILSFYIVSFIYMHPPAGIAYTPILISQYIIATSFLNNFPSLSLLLFTLSWISQFIGHGVFEKRAPALLTNLPQSLHAAVFFVWLELLFKLGWLRKWDIILD
jgi:2-hydroxy fatty acid dioxygenase